jgi:tetratricopeptide (TPR) repeat protein
VWSKITPDGQLMRTGGHMARLLILLALVLVATPAWAQTRDENSAQCANPDADIRIKGCTALINSGQENQENLAIIYTNRGVAENKKGLYDKAIADATKAISLSPGFANAYAVRGSGYRLKGSNDQAIVEYNKALELKSTAPIRAIIVSDRGKAFENKGMHDAAIADFSQAIALNPDFASAYNGRAWSLHVKGEDAKGLPDVEKALTLAANNAVYIETRAEILEKLGQRDKAVADYRAALKLDPTDDGSKAGLKRLGAAP